MIKRGEIWWASLPEPNGSSPGFRRPLVIVQSDSFNQSRISTVIAAVITSNIRLADAPGNVLLPTKIARLKKDSIIDVSQLITVDKSYLTEKTGKLPAKLLQELEEGLRLVLAL